MPTLIGQIEKKTQERVQALPSQRLGYTCIGNRIDRPASSNIEPERQNAWLASRGESDTLAARALNAAPLAHKEKRPRGANL